MTDATSSRRNGVKRDKGYQVALPKLATMGTEAEGANEANSKSANGIRVLGIRGQTCWYPNELKHKAPPSPSRQQNR